MYQYPRDVIRPNTNKVISNSTPRTECTSKGLRYLLTLAIVEGDCQDPPEMSLDAWKMFMAPVFRR